MKYFLNIEQVQEIDELMNSQPIMVNIPFDSEKEVRDSAQGMVNFLFYKQAVEVFLIINKHEENLPCEKIKIEL